MRALEQQNEQHRAAIQAVRADATKPREAIAACEEEIRALAQQRVEKEGATTQNAALVRKWTDERRALGREAARLAEQKSEGRRVRRNGGQALGGIRAYPFGRRGTVRAV